VLPRNFNPRAYVRHDLDWDIHEHRLVYFNPRAYVRHDLVSLICWS